MSIWIEIHCDTRHYGNRPDNVLRSICNTHENMNPAVMVRTKSELYEQATKLEVYAKAIGWKLSRGQWICPGCQKYGGAQR